MVMVQRFGVLVLQWGLGVYITYMCICPRLCICGFVAALLFLSFSFSILKFAVVHSALDHEGIFVQLQFGGVQNLFFDGRRSHKSNRQHLPLLAYAVRPAAARGPTTKQEHEQQQKKQVKQQQE